MKRKFLITVCVFVVIFFIACDQRTEMEQTIPGTYVRVVENEFSRGRDTLTIRQFNDQIYTIDHKGTFQRIKNESLLPTQGFHEKWTAIFDEKNKILKEVKRGKVLSFKPSEKILLVGESVYKKIK